MKIKHLIALLGALLGIGAMAFAGFQLYTTQKMYQEGDSAYESLLGSVRYAGGLEAWADADGAMPGGAGSYGDFEGSGFSLQSGQSPGAGQILLNDQDGLQLTVFNEVDGRPFTPMVDFETLRSINKDASAWLYSPGAIIDYPVMAATDYEYYLGHLPDGTKNANGSLFIDYNNAPDFSEQLTVIYGHHMKSGKMFGDLKGYKTQSFYEEHPYMFLYTDHANYRIDLLYGSVIDAIEWSEQAFMYEENLGDLLEFAKRNTTFKSNGVEYNEGDRIVVLSTCSYEFNEARYFVLGVLRNI